MTDPLLADVLGIDCVFYSSIALGVAGGAGYMLSAR